METRDYLIILYDYYGELLKEDSFKETFCNSYHFKAKEVKDVFKDKSDYNKIKKPDNFNDIVNYSLKLSKDFDFVRVDFYHSNNRIYLSELTFSPSFGSLPFKTYEKDLQYGNYLDLKYE